ncbi:hypothetical protein BB561_002122 [Smittium simulii]|uniref:25S rRNA adenine-N(1) methyltransferase n=1 Tax=Smittium simulii TaxID=133385 RepID=A0A2T9YRP2_9FUNG|nr:hypothetical protein BB561_002122 [Smittium simulii]
MPKAKKTRLPVTAHKYNIVTKNNTKKKATAIMHPERAKNTNIKRNTLIREYHVLNKQLSYINNLEQQLAPQNANNKQKREQFEIQKKEILERLEQLGGIEAYQKQSLAGQSKLFGGDTSRWLVAQLFNLKILPQKPPLSMLEVGAVSPFNYAKELKYIKPVCIDLNSQHPNIHQIDFLDVELSSSDSHSELCGPFDIISLSLVVNFEGDILKRGNMLIHAANLLVPKTGLLFFVLPLPCLSNSRYFDHAKLISMLDSLGMECIASHNSLKLAHYLFRSIKSVNREFLIGKYPKTLINDRPGKNNFCIKI